MAPKAKAGKTAKATQAAKTKATAKTAKASTRSALDGLKGLTDADFDDPALSGDELAANSSSNSKGAKKRPAAAMKRPAAAAAAGDGEGRDRMKAKRYKQIKEKLPDFVKNMIKDSGTHDEGARLRTTNIINEMFDKDPDTGHLTLNLTKPMFTKEKIDYEKTYKKDESQAIPRSLMIEKFKDGEDGLKRAIKKNEIREFELDGVQYCAHRVMTVGSEKGEDVRETLRQGIKLDTKQAETLQNSLQHFKLEFDFSSRADMKALRENTIPPKAWELIDKALEQANKLEKEGDELYAQVQENPKKLGSGSAKHLEDIENALLVVQAEKGDLEKAQRFKKDNEGKPIGLIYIKRLVSSSSLALEKLYETIATKKALYKANGV